MSIHGTHKTTWVLFKAAVFKQKLAFERGLFIKKKKQKKNTFLIQP